AEGTAPLTYQWYFGQNSLADATDAALILHQVSPGQAGDYAVVVRNDYGSATSAPAHLSVAAPAMVVSGPTNQVATNGDTVFLTVIAEGTQPLIYQWYFNETNSLAEATNATLVLSNVTPAQAGNYAVSVSNPYGSETSEPAQLFVLGGPVIVVGPQTQEVLPGGTAIFTVSAT